MRGLRTKEKNLGEKNNLSSKRKVFDEEKSLSVDFVKQESLHVLHVDDDASFLQVSKLILELENKFEIDTVTSVDAAFCKLKTRPYDAVVCDYDMPLKNGLDFLKELREQENNIAFIIFTSIGREEVAIRALNLGADLYFSKSGSPEAVYGELADAIRKIVEAKKNCVQQR
jgi:DNA-binding NarL/FixJ family response regulator